MNPVSKLPIATSILLSVVVSLILWVVRRLGEL